MAEWSGPAYVLLLVALLVLTALCEAVLAAGTARARTYAAARTTYRQTIASLARVGQLSLVDPVPAGATAGLPSEEQRRIALLGGAVVRQTGVDAEVAVVVERQADPYREQPVSARVDRAVNAYEEKTAGRGAGRAAESTGGAAAGERAGLSAAGRGGACPSADQRRPYLADGGVTHG